MKTKLFASSGAGITLSAAALALFLTVPVLGQTRVMSAASAMAVSSATSQLPNGTKIIAQVPLHGEP